MTRHDDAVVSVVPAIRLASVTVLQHSFAYDYGLATAEASKLFQPYEPRRDLFAGASLLDQGPKQPPKKFQRTGNESHEAIHR